VYALTSSGSLILMRAAGRTIDKSVNLQARDLTRERMGLGIRLFRSLRIWMNDPLMWESIPEGLAKRSAEGLAER
jgi:hypothetical protein